jgi:hypothetical protein
VDEATFNLILNVSSADEGGGVMINANAVQDRHSASGDVPFMPFGTHHNVASKLWMGSTDDWTGTLRTPLILEVEGTHYVFTADPVQFSLSDGFQPAAAVRTSAGHYEPSRSKEKNTPIAPPGAPSNAIAVLSGASSLAIATSVR